MSSEPQTTSKRGGLRRYLKTWARAIPYFRPYWPLGAGSVVVTLTSVGVALLAPWPLAFLIDGVLGGQNGGKHKTLPSFVTNLFGHDPHRLILFAVLFGLVLALASSAIGVLDEYVHTRLDQSMVRDFRSDLFENAQRQSLAYHDQRRVGDFIARINFESGAIGRITVAVPPLLQSFITLIGMAWIAYRIDAELALLSLTVIPLIYYSTGFYAKRIEPHLRHVRGLEGRSLGIVYEAMRMLRVIAAFGREPYEHTRFRDQASEAVGARVRVTIRQTLFSLAVNLITATGTALVLGVGAAHVLSGHLTVGQMLVVLSYVHAVYQPLSSISHTVATLQEQLIYLELALELLDNVPEIQNAPYAVPLRSASGAVAFENVHFNYVNREDTLKDITFEVSAGEVVALVGPTGAGKTTLISMLPRFCDVKSGRVRIDGLDVRTLTLESLRAQISVVLQEPIVFTGTVAENLRYGRLDATMEEITEAARNANAHDFITGLPDQYATVLGEGGTSLSGGEKQRLCVARAFLKDAPILILDEPTSSIDSKTEEVILDALDKLMVGRTTFMIAHRLSTVRHADKILVLDHGELVEQGTHDELLENHGLYRQLHDTQITGRRRLRFAPLDLEETTPAVHVTNGNGHHEPTRPHTVVDRVAETIITRLTEWRERSALRQRSGR